MQLTNYAKPGPRVKDGLLEYEWQLTAAQEIATAFQSGHRGVVLRGGTGVGKEHIKCEAMLRMIEMGLITPPENSANPLPFLWLCPKNMKITAQRVLKQYGLLNMTLVMTYGAIKAKDGTDIFIKYEDAVINGEPDIVPVWNGFMRPKVILCNEIQKLKNPSSMISKVIRYAPDDVWWIGDSATPWQRVSDARTTIERVGAITKFNALPATRATAPAILRDIAWPKHPDDYSPSAVERLRHNLEPYIVEIKNVRFKHPARTRCESIPFRSTEHRALYEAAYQEYLEECRKQGKGTPQGIRARWVAQQKFQQKAELLRAEDIVEYALKAIANNRQVLVGSNYVETLRQCWRIAVKKYGLSPDKIGFIVGGQSDNERQKMIDDYQEGKTLLIFVTMQSGGAGISLHHDRPTTRPRTVILPPTWSAIDLVQILGRAHRLTTISSTEQIILWYGGTVEDKVKAVVEKKLKCITKSVTAKEQFSSVFERASDEDLEEESDSINEVLESDKHKNDTDNNVDEADSDVTGEGLDNVELPTQY